MSSLPSPSTCLQPWDLTRMDLSGWGRLESLFGREAGDQLRYECRREHHAIEAGSGVAPAA